MIGIEIKLNLIEHVFLLFRIHLSFRQPEDFEDRPIRAADKGNNGTIEVSVQDAPKQIRT